MATYLTKAGVIKLEADLKDLRKQRRTLEEEVRIARDHGDLRENAEYHAAKERLTQVMEKLTGLQYKLAEVCVVDPSQHKTDVAILGTRVTVKDLSSGSKDQYILVGPDEADPVAGKISMQSPLGRAFIGHKIKEKVIATLPGGPREFEILSIEAVE
ncbi:MAG: transcription elongation factor GreA [Candidatus Omnitrophota bacterium]|nr:transcription elongation factor GreA [Candidatus Omnitrophota bacterium]